MQQLGQPVAPSILFPVYNPSDPQGIQREPEKDAAAH